jgi:hypothetical protein
MGHSWRFFRAGGVDQVQLTRGADLAKLGELDQKLWVALACPVEGLEIDAHSLKLIDTDGDGRVRARELIEAARWTCSMLRDPDSLSKAPEALALENIDTASDEGKQILATAKSLLQASGKADQSALAKADVDAATSVFEKQALNGDGIITPASARDDATAQAIKDIVSLTDAPLDRSGDKGVSADSLGAFLTDLKAYVGWLDAGQAEAVLPLAENTASAYAAFDAVRDKVHDYFARTKVAAYDGRSLDGLNREQSEYTAIGGKPLSANLEEVAHFPLARIEAGRPLPLSGVVNPAWAARLEALQKNAVLPLLGARASLTSEDWATLCTRFQAHGAWLASKPGNRTASLSSERARELLNADLEARLRALFAEDEAEKPHFAALSKVEKLVYLHRDLYELANNFVSFRGFYARSSTAAFQFGRLFVDQRECELVMRVNDAGKHASLAPMSKCYLLYCDIRNAQGKKAQIVAALTSGDSDNLMVGRNGIFYDRAGNDWDATITKIVDSPISLGGAFWAPYKKVLRSIEEYVAKRAAAAEADSSAKLDAGIASAQSAAGGAPKPVEKPKFDIGVVAALGVAVGGITAAIGALLQAFFGLGLFMPIGLVGLLLLISGPSMAVTWLKLRQRDLGPLLDANGWAINTKAKINVAFGESLTKLPRLPEGASRDLTDPFAEKSRPWGFYAFLCVLLALGVAWYIGKVDQFLPEPARSTTVLGSAAPAHVKVPEAAPAK